MNAPRDGPETATSPRSANERARLVAVAILVAAATLFAVVNLDKVTVDLVVDSVRIPLIFVIVGCLLIGAAIGTILSHRRSTARR